MKLLCPVADRAGVNVEECDPGVRAFLDRTGVKVLSDKLDRELETARGAESC